MRSKKGSYLIQFSDHFPVTSEWSPSTNCTLISTVRGLICAHQATSKHVITVVCIHVMIFYL